MYESRIKHLKELHRVLDDKIFYHERNHPHSHVYELAELKKQKLLLKDEIMKLEKLQLESSSSNK
jgi:uncharacterized protein YdcH (DUF465 family)